jgi:hypothetical protein
MSRKSQILVACLATSTLAVPALGQQDVHPLKRQSPEQQKKDDAQCFAWSVQQTGFDPTKPWLASEASPPRPTAGSSLRTRSGTAGTPARRDAGDAAVAGALGTSSAQPAAGAAAAAIIGRDAGTATPGGAVAGATVQRDLPRKVASQQELAVSPQQQAGQASFQKARIACLEARGYAVQ